MLDLRRRNLGRRLAQDSGLDETTGGKDLARFLGRGVGDERATIFSRR